jgi:hypothetical protein
VRRQFVIHAGMVTPESACSDDGNVDSVAQSNAGVPPATSNYT